MAYALPEKQREYQRNWVHAKKQRTQKDESLSRSVITWQELQEVTKFDDVASYKECVGLAREIIHSRRINRIAIATLALKACKIKWGGRRAKNKRDKSINEILTLKSFAKEADINASTLWNWVKVKRAVFDRLDKNPKSFDFTAASIAVHRAKGMAGKDPVARYYSLLGDSKERRTHNFRRWLGAAQSALNKNLTYMTPHDRKWGIEVLQEMLGVLRAH